MNARMRGRDHHDCRGDPHRVHARERDVEAQSPGVRLRASKVILEETQRQVLVRKDDTTGGSAAATQQERDAIEQAAAHRQGPQAPRARFSPVKALGFDDPDTQRRAPARQGSAAFARSKPAHSPDGQTSGRAYLYFWPGGQTERAAIQLGAESSTRPDDGMIDSRLAAHRQGANGRRREIDGAASRRRRPRRSERSIDDALKPPRGFTLLEVMVAVAILGLSLTVILSAQAGLYSGGTYGQHTSIAIGLARCRMTELEERARQARLPRGRRERRRARAATTTRDRTCAAPGRSRSVELPQPPTTGAFDCGRIERGPRRAGGPLAR